MSTARALADDGAFEEADHHFAVAAAIGRELGDDSGERTELIEWRVELYESWAQVLREMKSDRARWQATTAVAWLLRWSEAQSQVDDEEGSLSHAEKANELGETYGVLSDDDRFTIGFQRGRSLVLLERYREAHEQLDALVAALSGRAGRQEALAGIRLLRALARAGLRRTDDAVADADVAAQLNRSLTTLANNFAFAVLWASGEYGRAWSKLDVDLDSIPLPEDPEEKAAELLRRGQSYFYRGEFPRAQALFEHSAEHDSTSIELWATLVDFYLDRSEHDLEHPDKWFWLARDAFDRVGALCGVGHGDETDTDANTHLKLGALLTALSLYEEAEDHLQKAIDYGGDLATAKLNMGMICFRRKKFRAAVQYFDAAVRAKPDNLVVWGLLGDSNTHLELFDLAEEAYRKVLANAPGNIEAHIGLGDAATGRGDAGEVDAYREAIRAFDEALALDNRMNGALRTRNGSIRLSRRQRARVLYSRGYARAKLYEQRTVWKSLPREAPGLLRRARKDFEDAKKEDPGHFRAARALDKLGGPLRELPKRFIDEWGPVMTATLALGILVYVQVSFFDGSDRIRAVHYVTLTFGLLMFFVAGLLLPEITKLKVGGAELQKTTTEPMTIPVALGIAREWTELRATRFFPPDWARGVKAKPAVLVAKTAESAAKSSIETLLEKLRELGRKRQSSVGDAASGANPPGG